MRIFKRKNNIIIITIDYFELDKFLEELKKYKSKHPEFNIERVILKLYPNIQIEYLNEKLKNNLKN